MNEHDFDIYCKFVELNKQSLKCDLETVENIMEKQLLKVHYSKGF
jgi:hypothetical protein